METITLPMLSTAVLVATANTLLTAFFQYVPGVRVWFAAKSSEAKQGVFLLSALGLAVLYFVLSLVSPETLLVAGLAIPPVTIAGALSALIGVVLGGGAADGFYNILPKMKDVEATKAERPG